MPSQKWIKHRKLVESALIVCAASILLIFILINLRPISGFFAKVLQILQPILIGIVLAYLVSPICSKMEAFFERKFTNIEEIQKRKKIASLLAVTLSVLLILVIVVLLILLILPQLVTSIKEVLVHPGGQDNFTLLLQHIFKNNPELEEATVYLWQKLSEWIETYSLNTILPNMNNIVTTLSSHLYGIFRGLFNFLIGIIVSAYCLGKRRTFALQLKKLVYALMPTRDSAVYFLEKAELVNHTFLGFFTGKLVDSLIIGLICFAGTMIMGTPHAMLVSVIIGVTNIIPFFGPFLGAIPSVIIILLSSPIQAVYFTIFIIVLQQFDGNILGPKILGDSTGLSSFWVLFSILLCGGLWGIVGMIIAVPLFAVLYNLVKEYVDDRLKKKDLPVQAYCYETRVPSEPVNGDNDNEMSGKASPDETNPNT